MSWRTWLGEGCEAVCDFNLTDYPDMAALCEDAAWLFPQTVVAPTREAMDRFVAIMVKEHSMDPDDFTLKIGRWRGEWVGYETAGVCVEPGSMGVIYDLEVPK